MNNSTNPELIVNRLLDFEVPKINTASLSKTQLTPVFNEEVGFSRAPVTYHIKKLKQDNESMLKILRGELPIGQARVGPKPMGPMIRLSDGCWKVFVAFMDRTMQHSVIRQLEFCRSKDNQTMTRMKVQLKA